MNVRPLPESSNCMILSCAYFVILKIFFFHIWFVYWDIEFIKIVHCEWEYVSATFMINSGWIRTIHLKAIYIPFLSPLVVRYQRQYIHIEIKIIYFSWHNSICIIFRNKRIGNKGFILLFVCNSLYWHKFKSFSFLDFYIIFLFFYWPIPIFLQLLEKYSAF